MTLNLSDHIGRHRDEDPSKVEQRAQTVAHLVLNRVGSTPAREAFRYPVGEEWHAVSWGDFGDQVRRVTGGLLALGIRPEERVAIASATRYEWIVADCAIMCAGAATTTIYPTTAADEVRFILTDSSSRIVFADTTEQVEKLRGQSDALSEVERVVVFDEAGATSSGHVVDEWVMSLGELEELGRDYLGEHPSAIDEAISTICPDSLATLIYTSGTTGQPKGVRLTHDAWTYEGAAIDALGILDIDDLQYLWLPLAHSFGKVLLSGQLQIGFSTAVDGRVDKIVDNLAVVQPTWMGAAPRIFEKARGRIVTMVEQEGGLRAKLFGWAFGVGTEVSRIQQRGERPTGMLAIQHRIADKLVLSKIRARFGGRLRFFVSGSAKLSQDLAEWFHAAGILIVEGYGLTETSAASFVNRPYHYCLGTVGAPLPGTEVSIADDGEVLVRSPSVMTGYHNRPDLTAEVLDADGWFHTGDIGELVDDDMLRITDRKKDLFKTSGGKYISPQEIEVRFKALCPYASHIVVHGEGRNFCSALITLDADAVQQWAEYEGVQGDYADIVRSPRMHEVVQGYIDELNAGLNRWETVKKFHILDHDLSLEEGEITPSLKVKRKVVEQRYHETLDAFYQ